MSTDRHEVTDLQTSIIKSLPPLPEPKEIDITRKPNPLFDPLDFEIQKEQYENLGEIGHGAITFVYLAEDPKTKRRLVVKVAQPDDEKQRYGPPLDKNRMVKKQAEAMMAIAAYQKNLGLIINGRLLMPEVVETGLTRNGRQYMAMSLEQGIPMREIPSPLSIENVIELARQYANLLESVIASGYSFADYEGYPIRTKDDKIIALDPKDAIYASRIVMFDFITGGDRLPDPFLDELDEETGDVKLNPRYFQPVKSCISNFALFIKRLMTGDINDPQQTELINQYYQKTEQGRKLIEILEKASRNEYDYAQNFSMDIRNLWRSMHPQVN